MSSCELAGKTESGAESPSGLDADARFFVDCYHADGSLLSEQKGWSLTLALECTDVEEALWVRFTDGAVVEVRSFPSSAAVPVSDLTIRAERSILSDILRLRRLPSEPYLFGDLLVSGPEPDYLRLDYIVSALGGRA